MDLTNKIENNNDWKDIPGYEGYYQVNKYGLVKSLTPTKLSPHGRISSKKPIILKYLLGNKSGYPFVILCKDGKHKHHQIHRLVATAFIPNPSQYPQVDHINAIRVDSFYGNLRWCTPKMNMEYMFMNGRANKSHGDNHASSKLSTTTVIEIRELYKTGLYTHRQLAEKYSVHKSNISRALNKKSWQSVT